MNSLLAAWPDLGSVDELSKGLKPNPSILISVPPQDGPEMGLWKVTNGF